MHEKQENEKLGGYARDEAELGLEMMKSYAEMYLLLGELPESIPLEKSVDVFSVFAYVYMCDNEIDNKPVTEINKEFFMDKIRETENMFRKRGLDKKPYGTKYIERLKDLCKFEVAMVKLHSKLENAGKGGEEIFKDWEGVLKECIRGIMHLKSSDFEFCFEILMDSSVLPEDAKNGMRVYFHHLRAIRELMHEIHDYKEDVEAGIYNSVWLAKEHGIGPEFFESFVKEQFERRGAIRKAISRSTEKYGGYESELLRRLEKNLKHDPIQDKKISKLISSSLSGIYKS